MRACSEVGQRAHANLAHYTTRQGQYHLLYELLYELSLLFAPAFAHAVSMALPRRATAVKLDDQLPVASAWGNSVSLCGQAIPDRPECPWIV